MSSATLLLTRESSKDKISPKREMFRDSGPKSWSSQGRFPSAVGRSKFWWMYAQVGMASREVAINRSTTMAEPTGMDGEPDAITSGKVTSRISLAAVNSSKWSVALLWGRSPNTSL